MARLRDVPVVVRRIGFWRLVARVWREVGEDHLFAFAAALAYAWLFALFPFIVFLLHVISTLPQRHIDVTTEGIHLFLKRSLPDSAAKTLEGSVDATLEKIKNNPNGGVLSLSLVVALWAASGGVNVTMYVMEKCYELDRTAAFRAFHKRRPMAVGLTAGVVALVMAIVLLLPVGAAVRAWLVQYRPTAGRPVPCSPSTRAGYSWRWPPRWPSST
jgi:membrane protein